MILFAIEKGHLVRGVAQSYLKFAVAVIFLVEGAVTAVCGW